ncbi:MAG: hypothetical protein ACTHK0_16160 [Ginsengibacter sp.]
MQKLFRFIVPVFVIFFTACSGKKSNVLSTNNSAQTENIFPVTNFLKGQLRMIDSMGVTPLKIITINGKTDSVWLKREDIRKNATSFLTPLIDSVSMYSLFSEKSFLDQTINAYTFSYDPKNKLPDSVNLTHWDVYMNPQTNTIQRIYLVKENADTTTQLTWLVNKWYSIRTIVQISNQQPEIKEEKMIWDFDE